MSNLEIPPSVDFDFRGDLNSFLFLECGGVSELYLDFDLVLDLVLYLDRERDLECVTDRPDRLRLDLMDDRPRLSDLERLLE